MTYTRSDFPESFLFGLTSDDEVIGGFDSFRFSVNWTQVQPRGIGKPDAAAMDRYDRLTDQVLTLGMRPCAVLDNSVLPASLEDIGGWRNEDIAGRFADFTECVMSKIGDRLFSAAPLTSSAQSQLERAQTPDMRATARSLYHKLMAQTQSLIAMRGLGMSNLGVEFQMDGPFALELCKASLKGGFSSDLLEKIENYLPEQWQQPALHFAQPIEWCAIAFPDAALPLRAESLTLLAEESTKALPLAVMAPAASASDLTGHLETLQAALKRSVPIQSFTLQPESEDALDAWKTMAGTGGSSAPWVPPSHALQEHWNLVADIGGTNTRLGVVVNGKLTNLHKHPTGTVSDLQKALHDLRDTVGTDPRAVVAAGAGPVHNGTIRLTNAQLDLSESALARATGAQHTFVINDFTAAAWSVAEITRDEVDVLQGEASPPTGTRLVVGPGTGLGVGALLFSEGHYHTVSGEGGHMGLSPRHRDEVDVFEAARQIVPECFFAESLTLEAEMFLSGTGLPILYQAVCLAGGQSNPPVRTAKDILQDAVDATDACAVRTARMFTEHLGAIMGDLAVALVPTGGVFLVGGVAAKNRWMFGQDFLRAFNAGGRFTGLRQGIGLYVSRQDEFGIVGANNFCKNALAR